jgi:hypothetical protein
MGTYLLPWVLQIADQRAVRVAEEGRVIGFETGLHSLAIGPLRVRSPAVGVLTAGGHTAC